MGTATIVKDEVEDGYYGIELVPVDRIRVDERYQRATPSDREAGKLAEKWDDRAAHVIVVHLRDDGYFWCIDGQRRVAAARILGKDAILAKVWMELTPAQEAELFGKLQERLQLSAIDVFKADLFRGEPEAIEIASMLRTYGYEIGSAHKTSKVIIAAVTMVRKVYRQQGISGVSDVLALWNDADMDVAPAGVVIGGLSQFLARYPEAKLSRVTQVLSARGDHGMKRLALDQKNAKLGGDAVGAWGRAVWAAYNELLRTNRLPDWQERNYDSEAMRKSAKARRKGRSTSQ